MEATTHLLFSLIDCIIECVVSIEHDAVHLNGYVMKCPTTYLACTVLLTDPKDYCLSREACMHKMKLAS